MSKAKSQAMNPPIASPSNRAAIQAPMFDEIDNLGEIEGKGGNARATLGVRCVEWASQGIADVGDAAPIYERYYKKVEDVAAVFGGTRKRGSMESGIKQNVSKLRQFLKMGGLKTIDPVAVINEAAAVVKEERSKGTIIYPPYEALLNIARKQCIMTQSPLTRQEMIEVNQQRDQGDVTEADSLNLIKNKLLRHEDTYDKSDEVTQAIEALDSRIESLGGTTSQRKQRERAEKKAKEQEEKRQARRKKAGKAA